MTKKEFILTVTPKIMAGLAADPHQDEGDDTARLAVEWAESLWAQLLSRGYVEE